MAATYEPIATSSPAGTTTLTFSSIPSTYTDLVFVIHGYYVGTTYAHFKINNDDSLVGYNRIIGYSGGIYVDRDNTSDGFSLDNVQGRGLVFAHFMDYSNTTTYKPIIYYEMSSDGICQYSYTWASTSAINRLDITPYSSGTWGTGSTVTLYGIKAA